MANDDGWGGDLLKVTGKIDDSYFEVDAQYKDGDVPRLCWEIGNFTVRFGTGPDWTIVDDGKAVRHPEREVFHRSTDMGKLVKAATKLGGRDVLAGRGKQTDAGVWKGVYVTVEEKEYEFTPEGEDTPISYSKLELVDISDSEIKPEAGGADDTEALKAKVEALWETLKPDHTKFLETVYGEVGEVLLDPKLTKWVEDAGNWS